MAGETIQVGEVMRCKAAGEEEIGAAEAEAGIVVVVVVTGHTKNQIILATPWTRIKTYTTALNHNLLKSCSDNDKQWSQILFRRCA